MVGCTLPLFLPDALVSKEKQTDIVIGVAVGAVLILLIALILILYYKRHLKEKYAKYLEPNENFTVCSLDILYYSCRLQYWLWNCFWCFACFSQILIRKKKKKKSKCTFHRIPAHPFFRPFLVFPEPFIYIYGTFIESLSDLITESFMTY